MQCSYGEDVVSVKLHAIPWDVSFLSHRAAGDVQSNGKMAIECACVIPQLHGHYSLRYDKPRLTGMPVAQEIGCERRRITLKFTNKNTIHIYLLFINTLASKMYFV